jgi:Flp pilus assembly protein TadD
LMNYARLNLSSTYNLMAKNDKALEVLATAAKIDPKNERIFYNQALLYYEMNNIAAAEKSFAIAVDLKSPNPRVYYNYGLLLNESKRYKEAEAVLMKGIKLNPTASELYHILTIVFIQTNDITNAKLTANKLKQLDANNPDYIQLFKQLGI